jgi:Protein of unknown function (DUF1302)
MNGAAYPLAARPATRLDSRAMRGLALALGLVLVPVARTAAGPLEASATVEMKWAIGTEDAKTQTLQLRIEPELEASLSHGWSATGIGRLRVDAYDRLDVGNPTPQEVSPISRWYPVGDHVDLSLRELYAQGPLSRAYLTIGKQQLVWGQADGLKVLDVLDPIDLREFILDDFDESRIPLWSVNAEIPIEDVTLQVLWIPDPSFHHFPVQGSTFQFTSPRVVGEVPAGFVPVLEDFDRPSRYVADSDAGARLSTFWHGWDLTLNYLYHYGDIPVPERDFEDVGGIPTVFLTPTYFRTNLVGGSASSAFGSLTVRSELAYNTGRRFPSTQRDGVAESDELAYVIGLDWFGFRDTLLSAQLFQSWAVQDPPGLIRDRLESTFTLLARHQFWNDTLSLQVMWLQSVSDGDGLLRPRATYALRENLDVWVGLDWFYGNADGLFGQFDGRDRVVVGFEWGI